MLTSRLCTADAQDLLSREQWGIIRDQFAFSPREMEVARTMFHTRTESDIAEEIGVSVHTVHTHIRALYRKASAKDRCGFVIRIVGVALHPHWRDR